MALEQGMTSVPRDRSGGGQLLTGTAAEALALASKDLDLLVCGSRGYGPARIVLLGSTSHALVRRAECPVVVVPVDSLSAPVLERGERATVPEEHQDRR
jgi:Universal stress protein family